MQTGENLKNARKAMIFAAGLGTRLKPLTNQKPKALATINGVTLLEILIRKLIKWNYLDIIINVHHFADQILQFLNQKNHFNIHIEVSDESGTLLDTGGGIQKAAGFLDGNKPFLVHNVDVITDLDLGQMAIEHEKQGSLATLAVRQRNTSRYLLLDDHGRLCGWENRKTGEKIMAVKGKTTHPVAFSGIHIMSPEILKYMNRKGPYSIIEIYLELAGEHNIIGYDHSGDFWLDVGKPEHLARAEAYYQQIDP